MITLFRVLLPPRVRINRPFRGAVFGQKVLPQLGKNPPFFRFHNLVFLILLLSQKISAL